MFGLDDIVRLLVVALLSEGHVLLEGNPGMGKTALVKALSEALGLGEDKVGRIQFTPDLMPADITGSLMPAEDDRNRLEFREGPIFRELLLADEINRATPKTQSAMLEAMAEFQVTVLGKRRALRRSEAGMDGVSTPFMVMATQNPVEQDGTFSLPEAQLDRFLFKVRMSLPDAQVIEAIMEKELGLSARRSQPGLQGPDRQTALERLDRARRGALSTPLPPVVRTHVVNIIQASNRAFDQVRGVSARRMEALRATAEQIEYPLGPRAATALAKAALCWSACSLTDPATPLESGAHTRRALAQVVRPALRHRVRIIHVYDGAEIGEADRVDAMVCRLALDAAPEARVGDDPGGYDARFAADLEASRAMRI
ncbi:MoxR-like ATPase (plasmid) [Rhodovulum sp. P5]|uniref:AAA family ATPase n=1 Tax=Rhodovulum sp. P5 TaxID=1564506 RepID=UPI0009C3C75B|nr:AAA family ATPase [Rhodovulum sp. P5]ARE42398.1 MoxR-like ATPase [Rhodovulum sp. P5]